jgi:hypothetical protein
MRRALIALLATTAVLVAACNEPRWDTPVNAYQSFARLARKGDHKAAYAALSEATRARLSARAQEVSSASGGSVVEDPVALFFGSSQGLPPVEDISVVQADERTATLLVKAGDQRREVRMVKEGASWRVELDPTSHAQP